MAKTVEQKNEEFTKLMAENGFTANGEKTYDGRTIYSRVWTKEGEVLWYGKRESRFEIKVEEAYGIPCIWIYKDGRKTDRRDYSTPKRAINAMREIVNYARFEF
jgi:hypothetical protein